MEAGWWLTSQLSVGQTAPWGASPLIGEAKLARAGTPYLAGSPWLVHLRSADLAAGFAATSRR
jgi:hypothetical protein